MPLRTGPLILAGTIVLLLQTSVVPLVSLGGAHPDLVLVLVVLAALESGPAFGGRTGLVFGAVQDLFWGRYLGLFAGSRAVAGYVAGAIQRRLYRDTIVMPFAACLVATWLAEGLVWAGLWMTGVRLPAVEVAVEMIWPGSLLNGVLGVLAYRPWRMILKRASAAGWGS